MMKDLIFHHKLSSPSMWQYLLQFNRFHLSYDTGSHVKCQRSRMIFHILFMTGTEILYNFL